MAENSSSSTSSTSYANRAQEVDPCSGSATTSNTSSLASRGTTGQRTNPVAVLGGNASGSSLSGGSSQSPPVPSPVVPLPDRVALLTLPEMAMKGKGRIRPEEVWDALTEKFSPLEEKFSQIQYIRQDRFRVWCSSAEVLEDVISTGVELRGHPVVITPYQSRSWVTITHLPYGLIEADIRRALAPFGKVYEVAFVCFRKVRTGIVKVRMDISKTIPTRLRVCGHAGLVFHQGQTRTCFNCGVLGHESKKCPQKTERRSVPQTSEDASTASKKPHTKRKRKRGPRAPPPLPEGGPAGTSSAGEDLPPSKRAGAPPLPASTDPQVELPSNSTSTSVGEKHSTASPTTTGPGQEKMDTNPPPPPPPTPKPVAPHLLLEDSMEAAANAPPHQLDEKYPRHADIPFFRLVDKNFIYVEEGEFEDNENEDLRRKLKLRGKEIREQINKHGKKGVTYKIKDPAVTFFKGEKKILEVPLFQRRSIILRNFKKSLT